MPVCSYLVHPAGGKKVELENEIQTLSGCELTQSEDGQVYILITETENLEDEKILQDKLQQSNNIECLALVFGNLLETQK